VAASNVVELIFRSSNQTKQGFAEVTRDLNGLNKSVTAPISGALGLVGALGAIGVAGVTVTKVLGTIVSAGIDSQEALKNLQGAVDQTGASFTKLGPQLETSIKNVVDSSRFMNHEVSQGLTSIIQLSGDAVASEKTLAAVADLAAARHMSFADASNLVAKASEGMVMMLRRQGIMLADVAKGAYDLLSAQDRLTLGVVGTATGMDTLAKKAFEALSPAERLAVVMGLLEVKFGGAAQRDLTTYAGQIAHLKAEYHDLAETIGVELLAGIAEVILKTKIFLDQMAQIRAQRPTAAEMPSLIPKMPGEKAVTGVMQTAVSSVFGVADWLEASNAVSQYSTATDKANQASIDASRLARAGAADAKAAAAETLATGAERAAAQEREKKRLEELAADQKKYTDALNGFLGVSKDQLIVQHALADAIGIVDARFGYAGPGAEAFASELEKISTRATETGGTIRDDLIPALQHLYDLTVHPQIGVEFSAIGRGLPGGNIPPLQQSLAPGDYAREFLNTEGLDAWQKNWNKDLQESFKRSAEEFSAAMKKSAEEFGQNLGALFADLSTTGGKNFAEIAAQAFNRLTQQGAKQTGEILAKYIQNAFSPVQEAPNGGFTFAGSSTTYKTRDDAMAAFLQSGQKQTPGQAIGAQAGNLALIGLGAYQSGKQGGSLLGDTISGALAGFSASGGNLYATLAAAVVAFVGSLLAPSPGSDYPYAKFGVKQGQAFFDPTQNINANAAKDALAKIQATYDQFFGGYVSILLKFPTEVLPKVIASLSTILPRVGLDAGGDIGHAASKSFWQNFQLWLSQGMPREIAGQFKPVFAQAFEGMGLTVSKFNEIWDALQGMDPAAAMKLMDQLTTAVVGMKDNLGYLSKPFAGAGGLLETGQQANQQSFASQLHDSATEILKLADVFNNLPISQQIAAAQQINQLTQARVDLEKQFFEQLASIMKSVTDSFQADIRNLTLTGMVTPEGKPDYQAQAQYLYQHATDIRAQLATATSPQEAQALGDELRTTINQIYQLGTQMGPQAGEAFRKWAIAALTAGQAEVLDRLKALGDAVAAENADFMSHLKADWDTFTGTASSDVNNFAAAIRDATNAVKGFITGTTPIGGGGNPPGGVGGGGGRIGVPIILPAPGDTGVYLPPWTPAPAPPPPPTVPPVYPPNPGEVRPQSESLVTIGDDIGAGIVAAISRSDALKAIAAAGAGLRLLSQTPTPPALQISGVDTSNAVAIKQVTSIVADAQRQLATMFDAVSHTLSGITAPSLAVQESTRGVHDAFDALRDALAKAMRDGVVTREEVASIDAARKALIDAFERLTEGMTTQAGKLPITIQPPPPLGPPPIVTSSASPPPPPGPPASPRLTPDQQALVDAGFTLPGTATAVYPWPPPSTGRDEARAAIRDALAALMRDARGAAATGGFPPLPTGSDTAADTYVPTHTTHPDVLSHPYYSLWDPNSPVLTPQIWAGWHAMQRDAGLPLTGGGVPVTPSAAGDAIVNAIVKASNGESDGFKGLAGMLKMLEWLPAIVKAIENQGKDPITIVLPPAPVSTFSAGPSTRRRS
jgi:hypothetical protein